MPVIIQDAQLRDLVALRRLFVSALNRSFSYISKKDKRSISKGNNLRHLFFGWLRSNRWLIVARDGNQLKGFAICSVNRRVAELYWLYVPPESRGQELGLKIMSAVCQRARQKGATSLVLVTHDHRTYYEKQGFEAVNKRQLHGVEMDVMRLRLNQAKARPKSRLAWLVLLLVLVGAAAYVYGRVGWPIYGTLTKSVEPTPIAKPKVKGGKIISVTQERVFTTPEVLGLSRQNYVLAAPAPQSEVVKAVIKYTSYDLDNREIAIYARAYVPVNSASAPILAFAPGTTGIGDQCAASLEQPAVRNWQNYESHMMTYAGQGYATIITDYEGMRDPERIHHYMIGELEGRAILDSVRALRNWTRVADRLDSSDVTVAGFSQGGHSALWADALAAKYAPDVKVAAVVGFAPVMDVKRTLTDITRGANINWFGPFVLTSYQDAYQRKYELGKMLQERWRTNLRQDALSHCIDSVLTYWGGRREAIYTPEFLQALTTDSLSASGFEQLSADLARNAVGRQNTPSAKLINQGDHDNVILPAQAKDGFAKLCRYSDGPVKLISFPTATHYNIMQLSLMETLTWLKGVRDGNIAGNCPT